jgi:hypothetical protein
LILQGHGSYEDYRETVVGYALSLEEAKYYVRKLIENEPKPLYEEGSDELELYHDIEYSWEEYWDVLYNEKYDPNVYLSKDVYDESKCPQIIDKEKYNAYLEEYNQIEKEMKTNYMIEHSKDTLKLTKEMIEQQENYENYSIWDYGRPFIERVGKVGEDNNSITWGQITLE